MKDNRDNDKPRHIKEPEDDTLLNVECTKNKHVSLMTYKDIRNGKKCPKCGSSVRKVMI